MYQQMTEEEKIEFKQKMSNQLNTAVINRAEKMTLKLNVGFSVCVLVCFVLILLTILDVFFWTIYLSIPILLFALGLYIPMAIHAHKALNSYIQQLSNGKLGYKEYKSLKKQGVL